MTTLSKPNNGLSGRQDLRLTPRQAEVLRFLERGRTTAHIAEELGLSRETVRNHVRRLLRALDVSSRLEAVAVARGELPAPPMTD